MHFAAAHYIPAESAGSCSEMHGHTYFANITIAGDALDETGFLVNFQQIKKLIHKRFDHKVIRLVMLPTTRPSISTQMAPKGR